MDPCAYLTTEQPGLPFTTSWLGSLRLDLPWGGGMMRDLWGTKCLVSLWITQGLLEELVIFLLGAGKVAAVLVP